ncbi:MAG: hypothetical protein Q7J06_05075 [Bacteroidales bacterium]|nr:hypothetical protein [Bacteroidales bacterium]
MSKLVLPIAIGLLGVGLVFLLTRKAEAAPLIPATEVPTTDNIMRAGSIAELNAWYNLIGELYIIGKISTEDYLELYEAYRERWYQLTGVAE